MTTLLNDDGTASIATLLMSSHHAFRRDIACFAAALDTALDDVRAAALAVEWTNFRAAIHGHHTVEDTSMFPGLRGQHPEIAATIDVLDSQHRAIDPLLERGDQLFADLPAARAEASVVVRELTELLATHLELEERTVTPYLRIAKEFPVPPTDEALAMYADGFAWSSAGIAAPVCDQIFALLPPALVDRLPAARRAFDERCRRVWGRAHADRSYTSVP